VGGQAGPDIGAQLVYGGVDVVLCCDVARLGVVDRDGVVSAERCADLTDRGTLAFEAGDQSLVVTVKSGRRRRRPELGDRLIFEAERVPDIMRLVCG
jgi:hypothetical protein